MEARAENIRYAFETMKDRPHLDQAEVINFIRLVRRVMKEDKIKDWNLLSRHPYVIMDEYEFGTRD